MPVTSIFQGRDCHFEKLCVGVRILPKFAARMAQEKFRVLFVRQAISRNMFRLDRNRFLQRRAPLMIRLTWQSEHQIDVDVRETCVSQNTK